jgi:hypothetical protein
VPGNSRHPAGLKQQPQEITHAGLHAGLKQRHPCLEPAGIHAGPAAFAPGRAPPPALPPYPKRGPPIPPPPHECADINRDRAHSPAQGPAEKRAPTRDAQPEYQRGPGERPGKHWEFPAAAYPRSAEADSTRVFPGFSPAPADTPCVQVKGSPRARTFKRKIGRASCRERV